MRALTDKQKHVVLEMAENDMNVAAVGRALGISIGATKNHISCILAKTGLNPHCFYDLVELIDMVREDA
jgi:DNA-binding CsgD family transcriptional regulator